MNVHHTYIDLAPESGAFGLPRIFGVCRISHLFCAAHSQDEYGIPHRSQLGLDRTQHDRISACRVHSFLYSRVPHIYLFFDFLWFISNMYYEQPKAMRRADRVTEKVNSKT